MSNQTTANAATLKRWIPAIVVLVALGIGAGVYHRQLLGWFGGDPDKVFGEQADAAPLERGQLLASGDFQIATQIEPEQPRVGSNRVMVQVQTLDGTPVENATVQVVAEMPAMGAMPAMREAAKMEHTSGGQYVGELDLAMPGRWPLTVTVTSTSGKTAKLQYDLATTKKGLSITGGGKEMAHVSHTDSSAKATPINDVCPVRGNEIPKDADTITWNGHVIGFCCPGCDEKWNAWSDDKKQEFVAKFVDTNPTASKPVNDVCPIQGGEVDPDTPTVTWHGHVIGFCCPGCDEKWNAWSDEKKQEFVDKFTGKSNSGAQHEHAKGDKGINAPSLVASDAKGIAHYTCAMHPSVKKKDPGTCPICAMDLEPVTYEELRTGTVIIDDKRRQLIGVRTAEVQSKSIERNLRAVGIVAFNETNLVDVTLKYRGWIGKMAADYTGKFVRKGDVLFEIYSPELFTAQQEYLDSLSSGRTGRLLESARNRLLLWDMTEAQLKALEQRGTPQQYVPILSPATGTIIEKNAVAGSAIDPGQRIYRIADLSSLWVEAELYESDLAMIETGHTIEVSLNNLPDQTFTGHVSYIYPYLDGRTRRGRVRIEVANPDGKLKPDMYATVSIQAPLGDRLVIPEEAILYGGKNNVVFLDLGEGRIRPQRIKLGTRNVVNGEQDNLVEVLDGLKAGDTIVTSGNFLIASESKLKSGIEQW